MIGPTHPVRHPFIPRIVQCLLAVGVGNKLKWENILVKSRFFCMVLYKEWLVFWLDENWIFILFIYSFISFYFIFFFFFFFIIFFIFFLFFFFFFFGMNDGDRKWGWSISVLHLTGYAKSLSHQTFPKICHKSMRSSRCLTTHPKCPAKVEKISHTTINDLGEGPEEIKKK